jgi:hypothetical protein
MADDGVEAIKEKVAPILRKHNVSRAGLFGSLASGAGGPDSDVDILVELSLETSLLDFVGIKQELEEALGRRVDLVEYQTLKPLLRDEILRRQSAIL